MKKRKSVLKTIVCIAVLVLFVYVGVNIGNMFIGGDESRLTDVTNILVAGVDVDGYRTDLILMCQINNIDKQINILQIPRDTRVQNNRNDKKINSAYFSGIETLASEVKQVTGLETDFFATVTFDAFKEIVDAVGGVTIDVPIAMNYHDPVQGLVIELEPGVQKLDGEHAMMFMRFRKNDDGTGYPMGDIDRNAAQKQFYSAIADKVLSPVGVIKSPWIFNAVMDNTTTDLNKTEVRKLMFEVFMIGKNNLQVHALPGESQYINNVSYFVSDKTETQSIVAEYFTPSRADTASSGGAVKVKLVDASGKSKLSSVKSELEENGFSVVSAITWSELRSNSSLIDYNKSKGSNEIIKVFGDIAVATDEGGDDECDVMMIIGKDFDN